MHKSKATYYERRKSSIRGERYISDKTHAGKLIAAISRLCVRDQTNETLDEKGTAGNANSPLCIAYKRSFMLLESLLQQEPQQLPSQELQQHLQLQQALPRRCQESRQQTSSKEKCGDAQGRFP